MDQFSVNTYLIIFTFIIGYLLITFEHFTKINKATVALMMAVICWVLVFTGPYYEHNEKMEFFGHHLSNIAQVVFFLLGALAIVETINVHHGFNIISDAIGFDSKRKLLWVVGLISFFLSAILDNLTTTVVMITLLQKLVDQGEERLIIGGGVVIAANAGGAWTPIGDVTTTMLWIGGELSTFTVMKSLLLPSIICLIASLAVLSLFLKGNFVRNISSLPKEPVEPLGNFVFYLGISLLVFVPIFRMLTGLPPFMGMLFGLSAMWLVTDIAHCKYDNREHLRVPYVLTKIDLAGTLFFLGILLCIDALDTAKILENLAVYLDSTIGNPKLIAIAIGLASAVVDNVPLVAASMGMYSLDQFPMNSSFWELIAFCAGTGGSILLIGSAAGVVFAGMEKVNFLWYLKRISFSALVGYAAGIAVYMLF